MKKIKYRLNNDFTVELGMMVEIITDNTDFEAKIRGKITFINEDVICLNDGELIRWEYIIDIIRVI